MLILPKKLHLKSTSLESHQVYYISGSVTKLPRKGLLQVSISKGNVFEAINKWSFSQQYMCLPDFIKVTQPSLQSRCLTQLHNPSQPSTSTQLISNQFGKPISPRSNSVRTPQTRPSRRRLFSFVKYVFFFFLN